MVYENNLPVVDGSLMVRTLAQMEAPEFEAPDLGYIETQIDDQKMRAVELNEAGFLAQAQKIREGTIPKLQRDLSHGERLSDIQRFREDGYFVINTPDWDDKVTIDNITVPYKLTSRTSWRNLMSMHKDYQALYNVPIRNWIGDIPRTVVEKSKEMGSQFSELSIWFVAKRSELENLVREFVDHDPVLVGLPFNNPDHSVVLKMWGDDLEEISLTLLKDKSQELNQYK